MTRTVTAVVERGVLLPREPLDLPEGAEVEVTINVPEAEDAEEKLCRWDQALEAVWEEAARYSDAWWSDFEKELERDRVTFEERV